ncbi:hypothetical protein [Bilophila wadsworthia]|uniref:hypothetical protein n=1 Tax=Bilophila wadsworthia TaxID=35833 RepID=UPI00266F585A|nr:hypothetical protein [Bilophila wadsworthia]
MRERREDIPLLAESFLAQCAKDLERPGLRLRSDQLDTLIRYDWPGNIRELQNVIRRAAITAKEVLSISASSASGRSARPQAARNTARHGRSADRGGNAPL